MTQTKRNIPPEGSTGTIMERLKGCIFPNDSAGNVEALIGSADFPLEYDDPNHDPDYELAREAAYRARGLIE